MTTYTWTTDASADWSTASGWSPAGGAPGSTDSATIVATGTAYTITIGAAETESLASVIVNSVSATVDILGTLNASGSLAVTNGVVTVMNAGSAAIGSGGIGIGTSSGGSGTVVVTGANSTLSDTGGMNDGKSGQGLLDVLNGGTVMMTGANGITVSASTGSNGTILVSGTDTVTHVGALLEIAAGSKGITVGGLAQGTVTVSAGGTIEALGTGGIAIGQSLGGNGLLTVTGTSSLLNEGTAGSGIFVGQAGTGTLDVLSGGVVTIAAKGLSIGSTSTGTGTVLVSGAGSAIDALGSSGSIVVGSPGSAVLTISAGGNVTASGSLIVAGFTTTSSGAVTVNAGALSAAGITVGSNGTGTLTVQDGGVVTNTSSSDLSVGNFSAGSSGSIVVNGGTLNDNGDGFFAGGTNASGSLLVEGGGTLITGASTQFSDISATGTGTASATVIGGTWTSNGSIIIGDNGTGSLAIGAGGVVNVSTQQVSIGNQTGGNGIVSITGGTLDVGSLNLAAFGTTLGTLTVNTGGTVNATNLDIGSGGTAAMAGGILSSTAISTIGGLVTGYGTLSLSPNFSVSSGEILSSGGTLVITGSVSGGGTLDLGSGSTMVLDAAQASVPTAAFGSGSAETLILANPLVAGAGSTSFSAVTGIAIGDRIEFGNTTVVNSVSITNAGSVESATVAVTQNGTTGSITLNNIQFTGTAGAFIIGADSSTGDAYIQASAPCFAAGTRIATVWGEIAVEDLRVGDTVLAVLGDDAEPIIWIGHRHVDCARHPRPQLVWPVRISAGAFGPGLPYNDLMLSPDHAVYINKVLVPVKHLINGRTITQVKVDRITYYHVELPQHDIVLAHGLSVESYLDMKDRSDYANGNGPTKLYPDFSSRMWEAYGCAPLVVAGPELASARAVIDSYAAREVGVA